MSAILEHPEIMPCLPWAKIVTMIDVHDRTSAGNVRPVIFSDQDNEPWTSEYWRDAFLAFARQAASVLA